MFIGKALMIAAAANAATIPSSWQPEALGEWQVGREGDVCVMILPLGPEESGETEGALTLFDRPDGLLGMTLSRSGWALPQERGTIKIWFDKGYGMLRPIYDQFAQFDPNGGNGVLITSVERSFLPFGDLERSIDVVIDGDTLDGPQRVTIPLANAESAREQMDACRASG